MARRRDSLAARREALGLTQEALARKLGVELSTVGRWERATLTPQPWRRPALASALHVSLDELDDLLRPEHVDSSGTRDGLPPVASRREVMVDAAVLAGAAVADRMGNGPGCEPGKTSSPPPSIAGVSSQVAEVHRRYQAARYADVRQLIPSVSAMVDELAAEMPGTPSRDVLGVRCSLKIAEAKLATKAGNHVAAWEAAEHARVAAEAAEDLFGQAAAAYQRTCALLGGGEVQRAEEVAVAEAQRLCGHDPHSLTWRGALMLVSAIIAARRDDPVEACRRLDHAEELARLLGGEENIGWTAFGPMNVRIHRLSAAAALTDPSLALQEAEKVDVTRIPAGLRGRQAQVHLDSAWAHTQLGEDPEAVIHMLDTERVAPELVRANPNAHELIRALMRRERRYRVPGLRGLAQRVGCAA